MRARYAGQHVSIVLLLLLSIVAGSVPCTKSNAEESSLSGYTGPKKRIAVIDFEVKAPGAGRELGQGMAEMLINALVESGRFIVLERTAVQDILQEQAFDISGAVKAGTEARTGEMLGAQLLVKGVVTEFKENETGGGLGGRFRSKIGGIAAVESRLGFTVRIFNASTGVIEHSQSIDKKVKKVGLASGTSIKGITVGGVYFKSKSMQQAMEEGLVEAVAFLVARMDEVPWQGRIVDVDEYGQIFLNAGSNINMLEGTKLDVYKKGRELIDPDTGLSLGSQVRKVGCARVVSVEEKFSIAEVVSGSPGHAKDIVKLSSGCQPGETTISSKEASGTTPVLQKPKPRVMVVIPEVHITRKIPDPAGETEIIRKFIEARFDVVDQSQIRAIRNNERVTQAVNDPAAAAALGVEYGAEVIIVGEAFSEFAGRTGKMISCRARVEARAIRTSDGTILVADGRHGSGLDLSENVAAKIALRNAGGEIAEYFIAQIMDRLEAQETGVSTVQVFLTGVDFLKLTKFEQSLKELEGVEGLERRNFSGGAARIDVTYQKDAAHLATAISEASWDGLKIEVTGFSGNKIDIKVRSGLPDSGEAGIGSGDSMGRRILCEEEDILSLLYPDATIERMEGRDRMIAKWKVAAESAASTNLSGPTSATATVLLVESPEDGGGSTCIALTLSYAGTDCHACAPTVDSAVLRQSSSGEQVQVIQRGVIPLMYNDSSAIAELVKLGSERHGVLIRQVDLIRGALSEKTIILSDIRDTLRVILSVLTDYDNSAAVAADSDQLQQYKSTVDFVPGAAPDIYDLVVSTSGNRMQGGEYVPFEEIKRFVYREGKYESAS